MYESKDKRSTIGSAAGRRREQILANILAPSTVAFARQVSLSNGMLGLVPGCESGETTLLLRSTIGPDGMITGLNANEVQLQTAMEEMHRTSAPNVAFSHRNISQWKQKYKPCSLNSKTLNHQKTR